jgi:cytochrome c oxidase assembly factor CtaG
MLMTGMLPGAPSLDPATVWPGWSFEPAVVIALVLSGSLYLGGVARLWRRAGSGHGVRRLEAAAFAVGWGVLALALLSPLHELGEALFSAHMLQHELLMVVAAPLLVLGRPLVPMIWALPRSWRRTVGAAVHRPAIKVSWRALTIPLVACGLQGVVMCGWHLPQLYDAAVVHSWVHATEHATFLLSAMLFWWVVVERRSQAARGRLLLYVIATAGYSGALGALLTFAQTPLYPVYQSTARWGLTPLADQQLAGLIMWIPAGMIYLVAALLLARSWISQPARHSPLSGYAADWPRGAAAGP